MGVEPLSLCLRLCVLESQTETSKCFTNCLSSIVPSGPAPFPVYNTIVRCGFNYNQSPEPLLLLYFTVFCTLLAEVHLLRQLLRSTPSEFRVVRTAACTRRRHQ